jgi:transaldolase
LKILIASIDEKDLVGARDYAVHGIITNPTIVAEVSKPWKEAVSNAARLIDGPFHLQISEDKRDDIIAQAEEFASVLGDRLIVKMCLTQESLAAMQVLQARGFKINLTGIVSIPQSFFAILYVCCQCMRTLERQYSCCLENILSTVASLRGEIRNSVQQHFS